MAARSVSHFSKFLVVAVLLCAGLVLVAWQGNGLPVVHAYHTPEEVEAYRGTQERALATGQNTYFMASGNCAGCHGHDPSGYASVTAEGQDVNVVDDWRSSIMANAARDPFWRAKVSHEVLVNPAHQAALENKCTACHAPMGNFENHYTGQGLYSIAQLEQDTIAIDGVSCVPCHIQREDSIELFFSGNLHFDTLNRPLFGPYADVDIFGAPMESFVGYAPKYGAQILDAGLCAGCHTLITETADPDGNPSGDEFTEQATYHEWLNSEFNNREHPETGITCQGCHVPLLDDDIGVVLSANYIFLQPKTPFGQHHFAGANLFMLNMLKENGDTLNVTATDAQFDSTIERTNRMLRQHTLLLETSVASRTADTAFVDVKLTNLAGHKFPSGYPSRRAWVELTVTDDIGDTLYHNGGFNDGGEIEGIDPIWEPHHDIITTANMVQIYEMVMGDVNGDFTTVLERAKEPLKDNRLAPSGFSSTHITWDTTRIVGAAFTDPDFNHVNGVEGSGTDVVHYHVPVNGETGGLHIRANVWYQTAPPRFVADMFTHTSPEIDLFQNLYNNQGNAPFLVRSNAIVDFSSGIDDLRELGVHIFPNPVRDGILTISGMDARVLGLEVYDVGGRKVAERLGYNRGSWQLRLPGSGTYVVVIRTTERSFVERVVAL